MTTDSTNRDNTATNRALFPRGLVQPKGGYRFSMDSLLLTAFAHAHGASGRGVDLGAGCGVVGLGLMLLDPKTSILGVDINQDMRLAALENAALLGLADGYQSICLDLSTEFKDLPAQSADFVLSNPPYRDPGSGRVCPQAGRATARFEDSGTIQDFCRTSARVLKTRGKAFFVFLAERSATLFCAMSAAGIEPKHALFVHGKADRSASMVLARGVRGGKPGMEVGAPLVLYEGDGERTRLTGAALAFCPFLECNPGPGESG